jgi:hypothetical protein
MLTSNCGLMGSTSDYKLGGLGSNPSRAGVLWTHWEGWEIHLSIFGSDVEGACSQIPEKWKMLNNTTSV